MYVGDVGSCGMDLVGEKFDRQLRFRLNFRDRAVVLFCVFACVEEDRKDNAVLYFNEFFSSCQLSKGK